MSDKTTEKEQELDQEVDATTAEETAPLSEIELLQKELEETKAQLEHEKKEHLFTRAEFDNYRRRSIMEKGDIIKTASEKAMKDILPVVDDFERGLAAMKESDNAEALLEGIKSRKVGAACLDVYEEESDFFFEDYSGHIMEDDTLARLISMPNVIVTSHQAFLTEEALSNIAETTVDNIVQYLSVSQCPNELCYRAGGAVDCKDGKCF